MPNPPTPETHEFGVLPGGTPVCWPKGITYKEALVRVATVFIEANLAMEAQNGKVTEGKAAGDAEAQRESGQGNGSGIGDSDQDGRTQRGQVSRAHRSYS